MIRAIVFASLFVLQCNVVLGQESKEVSKKASKLSREFTLWYYPNSFDGRRGLRLDVVDAVVASDGSVTAKATMYGRGLDRCTIADSPVVGRIENNTLSLEVVVKDDDNLTCRTKYQLNLGVDGVPEGGTYMRPDGGGIRGTMKRN